MVPAASLSGESGAVIGRVEATCCAGATRPRPALRATPLLWASGRGAPSIEFDGLRRVEQGALEKEGSNAGRGLPPKHAGAPAPIQSTMPVPYAGRLAHSVIRRSSTVSGIDPPSRIRSCMALTSKREPRRRSASARRRLMVISPTL